MVNQTTQVSKVVVVGASGFGRESLDVLQAMLDTGSLIDIIGVVDDAPSTKNLERLHERGITYLGAIDSAFAQIDRETKYVLGIGGPSIREKIVRRIEASGFTAFTAIHPTAVIGTEVSYQAGTVICAGAVISTNVRFGKHVHVNPNATIGHDSVLEDFVSINPGAVISGEVIIENKALIGAAATILQGLTIGENSVVGASSCVTRNVARGITVKGIPAR